MNKSRTLKKNTSKFINIVRRPSKRVNNKNVLRRTDEIIHRITPITENNIHVTAI